MTIKSLYPESRPALGLDFAKTKRLDPRVTYTRASTATYVDNGGVIRTAASGVPRFDHNPTTGESLGLLVEEARTNSLLYGDGLSSGKWASPSSNSNATLTTNVSISPSVSPLGLTTASLITLTSTSGYSSYYANAVSAGTYNFSVFVKSNGITSVSIIVDLAYAQGATNFNLSSGNVTSGPGTIQNFSNGWYRLSTYAILSTFPRADCAINFSGTSGQGLYVCGAQLEAGTFPTSYIPTVASTVTRAADVATLSNTGSSIFPTSAFTVVNSPFGTAGGGSTVKLVGPTIKRTAIYASDLPQAQINTLTSPGDFWRWRVLGSSFALPSFTTNGSVTVDWGDGVVETLTTAVHTFTNGGGYHDIGFRLNSGTFFRPFINNNATYKDQVIATGPAPASMKFNAERAFFACSNLKGFDATVDFAGGTNLGNAFYNCSNLVNFPLANTSAVTSFDSTWRGCSSLTSFPLINTSAGTNFNAAWHTCSGLTSFPLINTSNGTTFVSTWITCSSLTSFPLINTAAGTNFANAWQNCSNLTSFPLINTAAGTSFNNAWRSCSSLTSFPLINTGAGTSFATAWQGCSSLTSFPSLNFAAGTTFDNAWQGCTNLASFPANMFDTTGTLVANAFGNAFTTCALTAASIENILTSLVTNGQSNITLGLQSGTNAGATTWTTAANTAYATLITRGWTITRNA